MIFNGPTAKLIPAEIASPRPVEVWGGVECTFNRVGCEYHEQLKRTGHYERVSDLDLFASLGVKALRYPILWETLAPHPEHPIDWSWPDERLNRLRDLKIRPIVGFMHHGSGPRYANVTEEGFPDELAQFAEEFARRYPWVEAYTPINEPLTTARFSGLYGHWYPHAKDGRTFARILLNQCKAIALCMRAIRRINPAAQLIQTEDIGRVYSTPHMAYQAEFENERCWLTFDLLTGRVIPGHPMWAYLEWVGAETQELWWFVENPCPPDILGIDHYLTSNRYLDENCAAFPADLCWSNGRDRYVDIEAIRVELGREASFKDILSDAWDRYRLPLAVTEAHLGCTREEQLRWLFEVWQEANSFAESGGDLRAVTAWSLLGSYDWDSLLTRNRGHYESGAFDVRSAQPRPTALAHLIRDLATRGDSDCTVLSEPGWWRRPGHTFHSAVVMKTPRCEEIVEDWSQSRWIKPKPQRQIVILGTGTLGNAFARICDWRALPYQIFGRADLDITNPSDIQELLEDIQPWAVINATGYVDVDNAEVDAASCHRINVTAAELLARACAHHATKLLAFSSDMVFGGRPGLPYVESDTPMPLNVYGRSKALMESQLQKVLPSALIIRSSAFFGPWDETNFVTAVLRKLAGGSIIEAADDICFAPTYIVDLVHTSLDLLIDGESGIWHLVNDGCTTWADLARDAAQIHGMDPDLIVGRSRLELERVAPRPQYSVLTSERALLMPTLQDALLRYRKEAVVCV